MTKPGKGQIERYGLELSSKVYENFGFACSLCSKTTGRMHIHHIDFSGCTDNPNNNIENLQLICPSCHAVLHNTKRWKESVEKNGGYLKKGRERDYWREKGKEYYIKHKEKHLERTHRWYENNKDKFKTPEQREKSRLKCKAYREKLKAIKLMNETITKEKK